MPKHMLELAASSILAVTPLVAVQALGQNEGGVALRLDSGEMYTLNDAALEFVRRLDGSKTIANIVDELLTVFDVEPAVLLDDLVEVANGMLRESLLIVSA
jgi:hypothetical protein